MTVQAVGRKAFTAERWTEIRERNRAWRAGEVPGPWLQIALVGAPVDRPPPPDLPPGRWGASYDPSVAPEAVVDRWDWGLSGVRYLADGHPNCWVDFGPGVLAVFLGGEPQAAEQTVWFHPGRHAGKPLHDIRLALDVENPWFRRVRAISRAAADRWQGLVQVGMTDLGGTLDVLSTFRPGEQMFFDLMDEPAEVTRLVWEVHAAWFEAFDLLGSELDRGNPGTSNWAGVFSPGRGYMLQCDAAYMLGPDLFEAFVRPELERACERLDGNAFYHLDGPGQLVHLDALLGIEALAGIQWIPGAGARPWTEWPEVYRRIREAGKLIQVFATPDELEILAGQLGSLDGVMAIMNGRVEDEAAFRDVVARWQ